MNPGTIAAIATPLGEGGIAIIRISGPDSMAVADAVFRPAGARAPTPSKAATHTVHYGHVHDARGVVDEVLLTVLRAPRTYTREDTVEIACHGGVLLTRQVLATVLAAGARLAEPGEFTQRAFLNGRIDLAQAEAVADLIQARTDIAARTAQEQLAGRLSQRVDQLREDLMRTLAHVEAHIDFPDEDIAPDTRDGLLRRLEQGIVFMDELLRTARDGQILRRGVRAAIVGAPNAGKSSLLNQLLGHERAIVSPIAGTTRDTIEETASIRGIPVVFVDTAGLRAAGDAIEEEGIRRSKQAMGRAELVLHVLDASSPLDPQDAALAAEAVSTPRLTVLNKVDLPRQLDLPATWPGQRVEISCRTGQGIESLQEAIVALVWTGAVSPDTVHISINARHQDALRRARESTERARDALRAEVSLELIAIDLRVAANAVGEIVGKTTTDDLLDAIFSQFCLGK